MGKKVVKEVWQKAASPSCHLTAANKFVLLWPLSNTWFHGPKRVGPSPSGILIGSAVFAGLSTCRAHTHTHTHRQTDTQTTLHVTSIAKGGINAMHTMRRNKWENWRPLSKRTLVSWFPIGLLPPAVPKKTTGVRWHKKVLYGAQWCPSITKPTGLKHWRKRKALTASMENRLLSFPHPPPLWREKGVVPVRTALRCPYPV